MNKLARLALICLFLVTAGAIILPFDARRRDCALRLRDSATIQDQSEQGLQSTSGECRCRMTISLRRKFATRRPNDAQRLSGYPGEQLRWGLAAFDLSHPSVANVHGLLGKSYAILP